MSEAEAQETMDNVKTMAASLKADVRIITEVDVSTKKYARKVLEVHCKRSVSETPVTEIRVAVVGAADGLFKQQARLWL
jgi:GTPase